MTEQIENQHADPGRTKPRRRAAPARRFVRLHPDDNVVAAVVSLPTGTELEGEGVSVASRRPDGPQGGDARRSRRARRSSSSARSSATRPTTSRPARMCTCTIAPWASTTRITRSASTTSPVQYRDPIGARPSRASAARDGARRHAQLHRALLDGELLRDGRPPHRRPGQPLGHARRLSAYRRRHRALARHRLRHGCSGRRFRGAGARALGPRHASERDRRDLHRARLRGDADRPAEAQIRLWRGPFPYADDPGDRRHAEDDRDRHADDRGAASDPSGHPAHRRAGERADGGARMRRLGRLFRHHRQSGARLRLRHAGRVWRHRPCSPRRRRSTAPSTCSSAARPRRRSARS